MTHASIDKLLDTATKSLLHSTTVPIALASIGLILAAYVRIYAHRTFTLGY